MKRYIVTTHLAEEPTVAKSAEKALSNVKFRYRLRGYFGPYTYWTVREVAG